MSKKITEKDMKIATKKEALWMEVRDARIKTINDYERLLMVEKEILKLCNNIIKEEQNAS